MRFDSLCCPEECVAITLRPEHEQFVKDRLKSMGICNMIVTHITGCGVRMGLMPREGPKSVIDEIERMSSEPALYDIE